MTAVTATAATARRAADLAFLAGVEPTTIRLLGRPARTFAEHGANIVEYGGHVEDQMAKNWYVAEVGDIKALRGLLNSLRNVDSVFDAYRVTPS